MEPLQVLFIGLLSTAAAQGPFDPAQLGLPTSACDQCTVMCIKGTEGGIEQRTKQMLKIYEEDIVGYICGDRWSPGNDKCVSYLGEPVKLLLALQEQRKSFVNKHGGCANVCESFGVGKCNPNVEKQMLNNPHRNPNTGPLGRIKMKDVYLPTCAECRFGYKALRFLLEEIVENGEYYARNEIEYRVIPLTRGRFNCGASCEDMIVDAVTTMKDSFIDLLQFMKKTSAKEFCHALTKVCRQEVQAVSDAQRQTGQIQNVASVRTTSHILLFVAFLNTVFLM